MPFFCCDIKADQSDSGQEGLPSAHRPRYLTTEKLKEQELEHPATSTVKGRERMCVFRLARAQAAPSFIFRLGPALEIEPFSPRVGLPTPIIPVKKIPYRHSAGQPYLDNSSSDLSSQEIYRSA